MTKQHRDIQLAVDAARAEIVSRLDGEDRRDAVRILAHGFGFEVTDDDLRQTARELGITLS